MNETTNSDGDTLRSEYSRIRSRSLELAAPLSAEDACAQSMPDTSPTKWHLAHTTWFFETFLLERLEKDFRPHHDGFRVLFNSYYNSIGDQHPRPQRGLLTRPSLAEIHAYRSAVDERMERMMTLRANDPVVHKLVKLGLNHEQQHQELIITDAKHLLSMNPLMPAYHPPAGSEPIDIDELGWIDFEGGMTAIGHAGNNFAFDNETPRHEVLLQPYRLGSRLVTNSEYLEFVEQGAYRDPQPWLSAGWEWVKQNRLEHPLYWQRNGAIWSEFTLGGLVALMPQRPVVHLSYFEADAYARWSKARLPTEEEWECAAARCLSVGNFADDDLYHPRAAPTGTGMRQMFGDAWEWTQSSYARYHGYEPAPGAIGEYNGKFMVNQYVLRGGSCATPSDHIRVTYRNFFPAEARWQFSGIRLARDAQ